MKSKNKKGSILIAGEIAILGVIGLAALIGAVNVNNGTWGKDGTKAVKNCPDHVNDNCAHIAEKDL